MTWAKLCGSFCFHRKVLEADLLTKQRASGAFARRGPVALFSTEQLVAYCLRVRRGTRLFVFRALLVDDRLAASLPGVRPRVHLLLDARSEDRVQLLRQLFAHLVQTGRDPAVLADGFYLRVGAALGGRLPARKVLPSRLPFVSLAATRPDAWVRSLPRERRWLPDGASDEQAGSAVLPRKRLGGRP